MIYDLLVIVVLLAWSISRVIQKEIIKTPSSTEFSKWTILLGGILVLPLIPFIKFSTLNIMAALFLLSLLWIYEQFSKFIAIKKEEVSRIMAFGHFKFLFAMILTILILKETATINTLLGGILMICGGVAIGLEKNFFKNVKVSNLAIFIFLSSMFASGLAYFTRQALLQKIDPFSIMFFSTIFAVILILPTIRKKPKFPKFKWMFLTQPLMVYGFLLLLWILSKQELVYTVPILAVQPLIILLLSKKFLKESEKTFIPRLIGTLIIVVGYLILRGFIF